MGRAAELAVLAGALDAARDGRPSVVLVEGEPGIGKTTLLRRFVDDVRGPAPPTP
ncbi:ATP-binding protein [Pseudonocardia benzenivorans]